MPVCCRFRTPFEGLLPFLFVSPNSRISVCITNTTALFSLRLSFHNRNKYAAMWVHVVEMQLFWGNIIKHATLLYQKCRYRRKSNQYRECLHGERRLRKYLWFFKATFIVFSMTPRSVLLWLIGNTVEEGFHTWIKLWLNVRSCLYLILNNVL